MKLKKRCGPRPDLDECKTYEFLHHHLVTLGKSKKRLAEELGVSQQTINAWTSQYDFGDINFHSRSNLGISRPSPSEEDRKLLSEKIRQQYREGRKPVNYKGREVRVCEVCGMKFEVIRDSKNPRQRDKTTCSRACADRKHSQYMRSLPPRTERVQIVCAQCGKVFEKCPRLSHLQFCSYECARAMRRGKKYEELYGPSRALEIKQKLAQFRSLQSSVFLTRPTILLRDALAAIFGESEVEYQIGPYTVDLCYPALHVAIEVDGNYWHNYPVGLPRDVKKLVLWRFWGGRYFGIGKVTFGPIL